MCIKKRTIAKNRNDRIITREEETQIVALLRSTEINQRRCYFNDVADLIEVLVDTGIRMLEAIQLRYSDVDFENNLIIVRMSMSNSHRRIAMTTRVATILKRRQAVDQLKPFNLNDMQIHMAWTWVRIQMGLKDDKGFILYALRWTCASRLINAGVDHDLIKEMLGHSNTNKMVTERYAQLALHQEPQPAEIKE